MFKILNGYENIDFNIFSELRKVRGPSMRGINYQQSVSMLVVLIYMFNNRIDKYLIKAASS